ncbi:hypothetical protein [Streptomyces sp. V1I1]|nr:hypothetical protein [Streptomyces sp. V1I1]
MFGTAAAWLDDAGDVPLVVSVNGWEAPVRWIQPISGYPSGRRTQRPVGS